MTGCDNDVPILKGMITIEKGEVLLVDEIIYTCLSENKIPSLDPNPNWAFGIAGRFDREPEDPFPYSIKNPPAGDGYVYSWIDMDDSKNLSKGDFFGAYTGEGAEPVEVTMPDSGEKKGIDIILTKYESHE